MRTKSIQSAVPLVPAKLDRGAPDGGARRTRQWLVSRGLAAVAVLAVLAACGGGNGSADPAVPTSSDRSVSHNAVDIRFATDMVVHHGQAIEMADMALSQTRDGHIVDLAMQIKAAQGPEIDTMRGWCRGWDAPAPRRAMSSMDGMAAMPGMSDDMAGMMSRTDMDELGRMSGSRFDHRWLAMMITHHQGAVAMAGSELDNGRDEAAKKLAGDLVTEQRTEIVTMRDLMRQHAR